MESGFVVDHTYGGVAAPQWAEGEVKRSIWTGVKMAGKKLLPVETSRCMRCGYLESYARAVPDAS
jgi:hypothetical protein